MSTNIKIYGTKTSRFQLTKDFITKFLDKAKVDYQLEEISDIQKFLQNNINSIPAVQIDNETAIPLNKNGGFNHSLRNIIQEILERNNYGKLERFIIPVDFSESSLNAFIYANRLARFNGEILELIHIYTPTSTDLSQSLVVEPRLINQRKKQLSDLVTELNKEWVGSIMNANLVTGKFEEGFAGDQIVAFAKKENAKYIVMSTSGEKNAIKSIFGSISIDVMKNAKCPVLLIPPKAEFHPIKNILFATENPKEDIKSMFHLESLAKIFNSKITLFHVTKPGSPSYLFNPEWKIPFKHLDIDFSQVEYHDVKQAIKKYIKDHKIDLVVVKPKRRQFLERVFHSSISKYLTLYSDLPIMAVK